MLRASYNIKLLKKTLLECLINLSKIYHHPPFVRYFIGPRSLWELPVMAATELRRTWDVVVNSSPTQLRNLLWLALVWIETKKQHVHTYTCESNRLLAEIKTQEGIFTRSLSPGLSERSTHDFSGTVGFFLHSENISGTFLVCFLQVSLGCFGGFVNWASHIYCNIGKERWDDFFEIA